MPDLESYSNESEETQISEVNEEIKEPEAIEAYDPDDNAKDTEDVGKSAEKKDSFLSVLLEYVEILVFSVCAVLLIFTLFFRLCRVNGTSMLNTLQNGQMLITTQLLKPEQGDIIVFHMTTDDPRYQRYNEPLVKRVIATEGQTVILDYKTEQVYVDGKLLYEPYLTLLDNSGNPIDAWTQGVEHHYYRETETFEVTVPEGCLFVMGDNRNNSADSRTNAIGFVDERRVLGKVVCRLSPFTMYD